ncbi:MAG: LuxR family transcriptional regulator [Marmoricola sp.]
MSEAQWGPSFGPEERGLLQGAAGDLYREVATQGSLAADDPRLIAGGSLEDARALLVELGLLVEEEGRLLAVDPALVQSRVVAPLGQRAAEILSESTAWATSFADLAQAYRRSRPQDSPITQVHGQANINRFLQAAVGDAQQELLTAQPAGARSAAVLRVAIERDIRALQRGVAMRTLYQHSARRSIVTREYVAEVSAHGAQVRTLDEFFNRLIVVDRRLAVVPASDGDHLAIAIHDPHLVAYLVDIFERYWERARAFADREEHTERAIADDVHNMTVRMLLEGHSDQASAKRMGVSTRTYAGYVAALKEQYGVETRFQLGHAMARRDIDGTAPAEAEEHET